MDVERHQDCLRVLLVESSNDALNNGDGLQRRAEESEIQSFWEADSLEHDRADMTWTN